jgi:hypothetical protein
MPLICPALPHPVQSRSRFIGAARSIGEHGQDCLADEAGQAGLIEIGMAQHADGEAIEQGEQDFDPAFGVIKLQFLAQQVGKFSPDDDIVAAKPFGNIGVSLRR